MPLPLLAQRYEPIVPWAESNIVLPQDTAYPGPLRLHSYQREILEAFQDPSVLSIAMMLSSQIGKSTIGLIMLAYTILRHPRPIMLVQPTANDIKKFLHDKFEKLVDSTPELREAVASKRGSDGVYNQINIDYRGGHITLAHSGSASSLRSSTDALVIADEVDLYPTSVDSSDPLDPLRQRAVTFGRDAKLVIISTPTTQGESVIEREFEQGDRRRFWVPCGKCSHEQTLEWESVELTTVAGRRKPLAEYKCSGCGEGWTDEERRVYVDRGEWRSEGEASERRSYHLSQLYSPMVTIQQTADSYSPDSPRGFWTGVLALPYSSVVSAAREPEELEGLLVEDSPISRPVAVTMGVDVQRDRLECLTADWDEDNAMHVRSHVVLPIGMDEYQVFKALLAHVIKTGADRVLVDRSYRPDFVDRGLYEHMRRYVVQGRVSTCRGLSRSSFGETICPDRQTRGYYHVATDEAKSWLSDSIDAGSLTVSSRDVPSTFLEHLCAERLERVVTSTGKEQLRWVKVRRRNEGLDCSVYALAARMSLGLDYRRSRSRALGSLIGLSSRDG